MNRILITGGNGQLGWELRRALAPLGEVTAPDRREMDLADPDAVRRAMRERRPTLVVNAAAYTAVDKAEEETDSAMSVNGKAPGILAEEAKKSGAFLVHYSTDYVFDGEKNGPYGEDDPPRPVNVYGKTKLAGEQAVQAVGASHLIFRTSWIFSRRGSNFLLTILRLARERQELRVVNDQTGAPTWSRMIAEITVQILAQIYSANRLHFSDKINANGIYHLTGGGQTSWFGFADAILKEAARLMPQASSSTARQVGVVPIPTSEYPRPARRPRNSLMSNGKLQETFGLVMPSWEAMLEMCLQEMDGYSFGGSGTHRP